jgi:EAL and modified HD-GYP domain-containing signal transduction protein
VLLNTFCESGINSITGGLPAFINFTESLLEHLLVFDPESLCIEILEGVEITEELIEKVNDLKEHGFKIAVDHFVWNEKYKPLLELCSYVKLDISTQSRAALKATVMNLAPYQVDILAEKVETIDEFLYCKKLGCSLYQGYFLFKPQIVEGEKLSTAKVAVLDLLSEIQIQLSPTLLLLLLETQY